MKCLKFCLILLLVLLLGSCSVQYDSAAEFIALWNSTEMTMHYIEAQVVDENLIYYSVGFNDRADFELHYENSTAESEKINHAIEYRSKRDFELHQKCNEFLQSLQYELTAKIDYDPSKLLVVLRVIGYDKPYTEMNISFASDGAGFVYSKMNKRVYFTYESDQMEQLLQAVQEYYDDPWYK